MSSKGFSVKFPFEMKTEVFGIFSEDKQLEIYDGKVTSYSIDSNKWMWLYVRYTNGLTFWHKESDIGSSLFESREDAEKEIKRRESNR